MTWSLKGFLKALQNVDVNSIEFYNSQGDFEKWAETSLSDKKFKKQLKKVRLLKLKGEKLRKAMIEVVNKRYDEIIKQT